MLVFDLMVYVEGLATTSWSTELPNGTSQDGQLYQAYDSALMAVYFVFISSFTKNAFSKKKKKN